MARMTTQRHRRGGVLAARGFVGLESDDRLILPHEPAWPQFIAEIEDFLASVGACDKKVSIRLQIPGSSEYIPSLFG